MFTYNLFFNIFFKYFNVLFFFLILLRTYVKIFLTYLKCTLRKETIGSIDSNPCFYQTVQKIKQSCKKQSKCNRVKCHSHGYFKYFLSTSLLLTSLSSLRLLVIQKKKQLNEKKEIKSIHFFHFHCIPHVAEQAEVREGILKALHIEWQSSTPRFASTPEQRNHISYFISSS